MRVSHTQLPSAISEHLQNIQDLIHFMVKTGFITRELWERLKVSCINKLKKTLG